MAEITDIREARGDKEPLLILEDIAEAIHAGDISMPEAMITIYRVDETDVRLAHHTDLHSALAMLELAKAHLLAIAADLD
jgi:hypothetical protein